MKIMKIIKNFSLSLVLCLFSSQALSSQIIGTESIIDLEGNVKFYHVVCIANKAYLFDGTKPLGGNLLMASLNMTCNEYLENKD